MVMARGWIAAACALLLISSGDARAADGDAPVADRTAGAAASAWETVRAGAGNLSAAVASLFATPDPFDYLPEQMTERDQRFLALMDAAGYPLAEIEIDGGLVGDVSYRFAQGREPSAADLEVVRRGLAEHAALYGGALAAAERRTLRGLLAVADAPGFRVAAVRVDVLPWPEVRFRLVARSRSEAPAPAPGTG
jgi:hypothetical protein